MKKGFASRKDAQLAYHAIVAQDERKESGQLTFREVYEEWLTDYRTKVKESTLKFSEAKLRLHTSCRISEECISARSLDRMRSE